MNWFVKDNGMMSGYRIYSCGLYYETEGLRELCHAVKDGRRDAFSEAIDLLSEVVDEYGLEGRSFIPIPNHDGKAGYTLKILEGLSKVKRIHVLDVLEGNERETLYSMKKNGKHALDEDFGFHLVRRIRCQARNIVLFDNVIDTGMTCFNAMRAIGMEVPLLAIAQVHPDGWY